MPTITEFVEYFGGKELALVIFTLAMVLLGREGWRLKKFFRRTP